MTTRKLYAASQLPEMWITTEGGVRVMWPARANGWSERQPYLGHQAALREVPAYNAIGTGWTGATEHEGS
jgi:hypothetical protein